MNTGIWNCNIIRINADRRFGFKKSLLSCDIFLLRENVMKKIKCGILLLILMAAFCMQAEMFQQECSRAFLGYYLTSIVHFSDEQERTAFWTDLYYCAREHNVEVFGMNMQMQSLYQRDLIIFCDEQVQDILAEKNNVYKGETISLISGNTNIVYRDFLEQADYENRYLKRIAYIGEHQNIYEVQKSLNEKYDISFPCITEDTSEDTIYLVWGLVAAVMVIMTGITVMYRKKEVIVRVCMGENIRRIILHEAVQEIIGDIVIFIIAHGIIFHVLSGEYMKKQIILVYFAGMVFSCMVYLFYGRFDVKKAFANAHDTDDILTIMYELKLVISVISIFGIVICSDQILKNHSFYNHDELVEKYSSYVILKFQDFAEIPSGDERKEYMLSADECYRKIFTEYYTKAKPVICSVALNSDDVYITANEYSTEFIAKFIHPDEVDYSDDIYIFVPKQFNSEYVYENAVESMGTMIKDASGLRINKIVYSDERYLTCVDINSERVLSTVKNPVLIYSNYSGMDNLDNITMAYANYNILFELSQSDLENIKNEFKFDKYGRNLVAANFVDQYKYYNNSMRRIMAFFTSMGIFCFVIQLIVLILLNRLEYRKNSMEHALKKIFGYNLIQANCKIFLFTVLYYILIIAAGILLVLIKNVDINIGVCFAVGLCMLLIEFMMITVNIIHMSRKNTAKILKGGCL